MEYGEEINEVSKNPQYTINANLPTNIINISNLNSE